MAESQMFKVGIIQYCEHEKERPSVISEMLKDSVPESLEPYNSQPSEGQVFPF